MAIVYDLSEDKSVICISRRGSIDQERDSVARLAPDQEEAGAAKLAAWEIPGIELASRGAAS